MVKLIRSSRAVFFSNLSRTANDPHKFWKIVNTLNTVSSHIPTLVSDNTLVSEDTEKAEVLVRALTNQILLFNILHLNI